MGWFGRRSHSEVPSWASFFDDERFRAFLTVVEAELVSRGLTYELGDGVVALHGPGVKDGLTVGLQNLAQLCNHEPLAAWSDVVSGHFAGMLGRDAEEAELARRVHDFEAVRPSLRVRLYGEEVAGPERVTWPVADGLTAALVFDLPTAVRTVSAEDAGRWGRSREELYAIGLANALQEPVEAEEVQLEGGGVVKALMGPSFFTSARALSLDVPDDHPYGALVAVPHRHVVLVHVIAGLEVVRAINTMIVMTNGLFREGPGSISSDLYWSRGGTVRALPSSVDETGLTFRPPEDFLTEVLNRLAEPPSLGSAAGAVRSATGLPPSPPNDARATHAVMRRSLVLGLLSASLLACSGAPPRPPESATDRARRDGPTSTDGEVVGRWLLGELLAPGGTPAEAAKARKRLGEVGDKGMYGSLARAVDDASHGKIPAAARAYLDTLRAARGSGDPAAPVVSWYATNHLLALDGAVPDLWKEAKPWVSESLEAPGSLGWRARSELVEWWSRHAFEEAEANLLDRAATQYGCARDLRLAGPFGHNASSDRWRSFPAEAPGPWPQRWAPDPQRAATPHVLKVERQGCTVRTDEPTAPGIFYAEATLDAPAAREVIIAVQGALAVWIDDHPVLVRDPRKWGVWPHFGVQVRLEEGRHRVVARLAEPDTSMRVLKVDGTPALDVKTLPSGASTYTTKKPEQPADPNVLDAFITPPARKKGEETPPDATLSFLAAHLAGIEGQYDVASVLLEPLHADQEKATALALATAATFAEKDPIFPETDARDLGRLLREKASGKDPQLFFPKLWLVVDKADKGMPDAARAVRAMVDEFPEVPEVLRVLSSLYARLGWRAERAQATKTLVERFPQDRGALEAAIGILEEQGKTKEADELAKRLRDMYPDSEIELDRALLRKDWKAALAELARLGKRRPDRRDIADRVASVLVRAGQQPDPVAAIERALKRNPRDGSARLSLADARFAGGDRGALRAALATALSQGAGDGELRSAIELVEGMTELEPYRIDGRAVIAEYEKDTRPLDGTAARVLDYSALWIHSDGSARMLEHELVRVQSQEAIGKLAEQRVPANALLLRMRVIKKDGTVLEPERVEGKPTITMPHLEIGDYIETENVTTQESDGEGGKRYLGPHWFFREADIAYWRSEFVVIAPKDRPLVLETTGAVPAPAVSESGPLVLRKWRVDRSPAAPVEPSSVPVQEFLPSVRVGWGLTQEGQLARMLDATVDDLPRDPRLSRIASRIAADVPKSDTREQARRLYRWIVANVEDGRETDGRRVVVGKTGSRAAGFLYLARALGLPVEVAVTRDRLRPRDEGPLSTALSFNQVVLRMAGPCQPGVQRTAPTTLGDEGQTCAPPLWFTVADKYAPFGFLPAELRGQPAVRLVPGFPREVTEAGGSVDGIVYEGTADLRADGSAILEIDQKFVGRVAIGVRATVEQLPEEQLSRVVESRLLARALPGARLMSLTVVDKDDLDKPVTFRMKVEVSDFARRRGDALALKPPLTMKIAPLAALETRQTPMLLPEATHTEVRLVIKLPQGATIAAPPRAEDIKDGERLVRVADAVAPGTLRIDRTIDIPAGRVAPEEYAGFRKFTLAADEATGREVLIQVR